MGISPRLLIVAVALIAAATEPTHAEPVESGPVVVVVTPEPQKLRGQAIAQSRADYMARRGYRGHPPKSAGNQWRIPGANFEGVGWRGRDVPHQKIGTCRPSGRSGSAADNSRALLGDAVSRSKYGSFRVRIWGRK